MLGLYSTGESLEGTTLYDINLKISEANFKVISNIKVLFKTFNKWPLSQQTPFNERGLYFLICFLFELSEDFNNLKLKNIYIF